VGVGGGGFFGVIFLGYTKSTLLHMFCEWGLDGRNIGEKKDGRRGSDRRFPFKAAGARAAYVSTSDWRARCDAGKQNGVVSNRIFGKGGSAEIWVGVKKETSRNAGTKLAN